MLTDTSEKGLEAYITQHLCLVNIIVAIKTETHSTDITISKAEGEIELIKEYREAMIAETVTGRAKVY